MYMGMWESVLVVKKYDAPSIINCSDAYCNNVNGDKFVSLLDIDVVCGGVCSHVLWKALLFWSSMINIQYQPNDYQNNQNHNHNRSNDITREVIFSWGRRRWWSSRCGLEIEGGRGEPCGRNGGREQ